MNTKVLIIEDEPKTAQSLKQGLEDYHCEVVLAYEGYYGLRLAKEIKFDVIVTDVILPHINGIDICKELRASGVHTPIIILTALSNTDDVVTGFDAGADDYLTKPFDFGELLARVRALTRRHGESASAQLTVGDLVIDLRRHTVHRGTREISLTAKEFAFLVYLARNAGTVVSRADLMAHVWDDSRSTAYSNIIDVYASRLRRKLDDGEVEPLFTTLRGTGFVLEAPAGSRRSGAAKRPE